jgi:hypothetical protein
MTDELKPCPFCGGKAQMTGTMTLASTITKLSQYGQYL